MVVVALTNIFLCLFAADVQCFGRDCYPAVFAINTVLIIAATSKFVVEKKQCCGRERTVLSPHRPRGMKRAEDMRSGLFPSCLLPLCQNECFMRNHSYENEFRV